MVVVVVVVGRGIVNVVVEVVEEGKYICYSGGGGDNK